MKQEKLPSKTKYEVLYEWMAPIRIFRKHHRQDYIMVIMIALVISAFFIIVKQYILVAVTASLVFLTFVMWTVPPDSTTHRITNFGVFSFDKLYEWKELKNYWFSVVSGIYVLNVDTKLRFPARLVMLAGSTREANKIHDLIQPYLKYRIMGKQNILQQKLDGDYIPLEDSKGKDRTPLDHSKVNVK